MVRIYIKGSKLVFKDDTNTQIDNYHSIDNIEVERDFTRFIFYRKSDNKLLYDYAFADILDESGVAYASSDVFLNYLTITAISQSQEVTFKDSANFDAFSRMRVSQSHSLFDSQFTYNLQPLLFEQIANGTGATIVHDTTNRNALFTFASTPTGGKVVIQSYEHFRYTSGKGQLILMTFNLKGGVANVVKFAGYSDGTEGMEFRLNGTTPQLCILSTTDVGNQIINQADWNLDKLDGTGLSGITLDVTKSQILVIDFQALYVGRVRMGFDIDGQIVYAHEFNNANTKINNYIKTANLPLRCGMTCTSTVSTTMNFSCSTVIQENGAGSNEGYDFTAEGTVTAGSGVRTHVLSIQPKLTFNSIQNRVKFILEDFNVLVTGTNPVKWELVLGDAITGTTTFLDVNSTYSGFQYNTLGTTSGTPAIVIASGYVSATNQSRGVTSTTVPFKYPITLDSAGAVRNIGRLSLLVTGIGGTSACRASINWKEIR